ncbi:type IX secretion system membrane protein PorP/SprF [Porifericola rhodea]|uniref:PorP/SprF family type IX secretion system membrane protein n=1 Tax=Porifericola rhodea TaxID=930972 RepID=UPI002666282D|nr:type IX secretion system membrane protein PorP/SprF [Porifericola rhodea]WKN30419.1 type IX secretion system membrane protein PorP/SprF [Porifericola rhodea]
MRISLLILAAMLLQNTILQAQQDEMFTQYMHNEVSINPAYAGSKEGVNVTALYRNQWMQMEGAPRTYTLNMHTPIPGDKVGLGLSLFHDQIGIHEQLKLFGAYSYKIKLGEERNLRLGLLAGIINFQSDFSNLTPKNSADKNFSSPSVKNLHMNFGAGVFYYMPDFYVGLSVPNIIPNTSMYEGEAFMSRQQHAYLTSAYVFELSPDIKLKPSLIYKFTYGAPMQLDLSTNVIFHDFLWTGINWRTQDSIDLLLGLQPTRQIYIGYAYDYGISSLADYHSGSHEILLSYRFSISTNRVLTPRYY